MTDSMVLQPNLVMQENLERTYLLLRFPGYDLCALGSIFLGTTKFRNKSRNLGLISITIGCFTYN